MSKLSARAIPKIEESKLIGKHLDIIDSLKSLDNILRGLDTLINDLHGTVHEDTEEYREYNMCNLFNFLDTAPQIINCKCNAILTRIDDIREGLCGLAKEPMRGDE